MKTIDRKIVSALIVSADKKLFVAKKKSGGVYADCWHIPGGGVEDGEGNICALKRELLEEIGIDFTDYEPVLVDNLGKGESKTTLKTGEEAICKMDFNVYRIDIPKNADDIMITIEEDEYDEYRWIEMDRLLEIKHTDPSIKLFKRLNLI